MEVLVLVAVVWFIQHRATRLGMTPDSFSWRRFLRGNR